MRLNAVMFLMVDRPDGHVIFEISKNRFALGQLNIVLPKHRGAFAGEAGAQQIMPFTADCLSKPVFAQDERQSVGADQFPACRDMELHQAISIAGLGLGSSQFQ
jgi:hypothetical protein